MNAPMLLHLGAPSPSRLGDETCDLLRDRGGVEEMLRGRAELLKDLLGDLATHHPGGCISCGSISSH